MCPAVSHRRAGADGRSGGRENRSPAAVPSQRPACGSAVYFLLPPTRTVKLLACRIESPAGAPRRAGASTRLVQAAEDEEAAAGRGEPERAARRRRRPPRLAGQVHPGGGGGVQHVHVVEVA